MLTLTHESILYHGQFTFRVQLISNIELISDIELIFVFRIFPLYLSLRTNVKLNSIREHLFPRIICFPRIQRRVDVSAISIGLCHVLNSVNSVNWRRMRKSYFLLLWYFEFQGRTPLSVELLSSEVSSDSSRKVLNQIGFPTWRLSASDPRTYSFRFVNFFCTLKRGKERKNIHWK